MLTVHNLMQALDRSERERQRVIEAYNDLRSQVIGKGVRLCVAPMQFDHVVIPEAKTPEAKATDTDVETVIEECATFFEILNIIRRRTYSNISSICETLKLNHDHVSKYTAKMRRYGLIERRTITVEVDNDDANEPLKGVTKVIFRYTGKPYKAVIKKPKMTWGFKGE